MTLLEFLNRQLVDAKKIWRFAMNAQGGRPWYTYIHQKGRPRKLQLLQPEA